MSPLYLSILLHQYIWRSQPGRRPVTPDHVPESMAAAEALLQMRNDGILTGYFSGYELTPKGVAFVENILATPQPVEQTTWVDPRFNP